MNEHMTDRDFMLRAIALARRGEGWVNPNPMVGAVIVRDGRVIAEGWHHKYGELHAERDALRALTEPAEGATIYVTLEPCCHYGKQPPCTLAIIEHGISRVVIGSRDPNPLVAGKGVRMLREHGITVVEDFMREECDALNPVFFHYITTGRPYVKMKYAMTADGKIATKTGASKWITGEKAREHVHSLRGYYSSILVGIGTVVDITSGQPLVSNWPVQILLSAFLCLFVGLYEETAYRAIINDALMEQFRDHKGVFKLIAVVSFLTFGAAHIIGADLSTPMSVAMAVLKTVSAGAFGLILLFMYWSRYSSISAPSFMTSCRLSWSGCRS